jgi:hypothetical protein
MLWLGRSSELRHPSGQVVKTPLLVPSFSSRGFGNHKGAYSVGQLINIASSELTESVLISAYDLATKGRLPSLKKFPLNVDLTFVDSGGYETGGEPDFSSVYEDNASDEDWVESKLEKLYDRWPKAKPAVFVSFDHVQRRKRVSDQIKSARKLLNRYPHQLTCFLIKPESKNQPYLGDTLSVVHRRIEDLRGFATIGMTEKELGDSFLVRMKNIAELRLAMDDKKINAPIHVFGSLDPFSSCLYFLSGAEIFDGLTWLRYAYSQGSCVYRHNFCGTQHDLSLKDDNFLGRLLGNNLSELRSLQISLKLCALEKNVEKLKYHSDKFREALNALQTTLERRS